MWFEPRALFFLVDHFAIGGGVTLQHAYESSGELETRTIGLGAHVAVGVNLWFSRRWSIFPTLRGGYTFSLRDRERVYSSAFDRFRYLPLPRDEVQLFESMLYTPLLFHVTTHVFVGMGPIVRFHYALAGRQTPSAGRWRMRLGAGAEVGAWF